MKMRFEYAGRRFELVTTKAGDVVTVRERTPNNERVVSLDNSTLIGALTALTHAEPCLVPEQEKNGEACDLE